MKRITIKDIAALSGVNPSTVSRALNNHPDVSQKVVDKIKEIAKSLKYKPNMAAMNLRNQNSKLIAIILPSLNMFFYPTLLSNISKILNNAQYKVLILISDESVEKEEQNLSICCNAGADGIAIALTSATQNLDHFIGVQDYGIPLVIMDKTIEQKQFDEVLIDDEKSAKEAVQKLIDNNTKHILCVMGLQQLSITAKRVVGINKLISTYNDVKVDYIYCNSSSAAAIETEKYITENKTIDGIFAMSDETLLGVHKALQNFSITIKNNINVSALSEGVLPEFINPNYLIVQQSASAMAIKSMEVLLNRINSDGEDVAKRYFL